MARFCDFESVWVTVFAVFVGQLLWQCGRTMPRSGVNKCTNLSLHACEARLAVQWLMEQHLSTQSLAVEHQSAKAGLCCQVGFQ